MSEQRATARYSQRPASAGYFGTFDGDQELSDRDTVARLNEQAREIQGLREELDQAHQHIGAIGAYIEQVRGDYPEDVFPGDIGVGARLAANRILTFYAPARAWLRRAETPRGGEER